MSRAELARALAPLVELPTDDVGPLAAALELSCAPSSAVYTRLFMFEVYPYASVHLGAEGQLGGAARDRVAGFLRALAVVPPAEPDHLAALLSAYAELVDLDTDGDGRARHARTALLHEHLWSWVPRFTARVRELAPPPYDEWAALLESFLADELRVVGVPDGRCAHHVHAPGLDEPGDDPDVLLAQLLAPVRSGLVLTRADLSRASADLDLGLRIGERRYALRALVDQDARGTLRWLADEADRQQAAVQGDDPSTTFWRERLATTSGCLRAWAADRAQAVTR